MVLTRAVKDAIRQRNRGWLVGLFGLEPSEPRESEAGLGEIGDYLRVGYVAGHRASDGRTVKAAPDVAMVAGFLHRKLWVDIAPKPSTAGSSVVR